MDIKLYVFFYVFASLCASCNISGTGSKMLNKNGIITKVSDGDSVDFYDGKDTLKIRLQHIDAPERNQAFSKESWQFLRKLIHKQKVVLRYENTKDRYGRIIGIVFINDENVNKTLVEEGYAWHFKRYSDDATYSDLEKRARSQKRGLWFDKNPIPPWQWRK